MANGQSAEVGFIGYEGIVGSLHLLGNGQISSRCVVQLAGKGLRISFTHLQKAFRESEEIRNRILQFVQRHSSVTGQIAAAKGCTVRSKGLRVGF
jgi:hypothetical protein